MKLKPHLLKADDPDDLEVMDNSDKSQCSLSEKGAAQAGPAKDDSLGIRGTKNIQEDAEATVNDSDGATLGPGGQRRALPARSLAQRRSRRCGSFHGSLLHVAEEAGSDEDAAATGDGGPAGADSSAAAPRRRAHPAARKVRLPKFDVNGGTSSTGEILDSTVSSKRSLVMVDSVNMMDFGVDNHQRSFRESMSSPGNLSWSSSLSDLLDSDDFLAWENKSNTSSLRTGHHPRVLRRARSSGSNLSNLCNLVDSKGFLGWDSSCLGDATDDLTTAHAGMHCARGRHNESWRHNDEASEKSWHIEDYEDPNDLVEAQQPLGSNLSNPLQRLSLATVDSMAAARRCARGAVEGAPLERVDTADLKQRILERRRSRNAGGLELRTDSNRRLGSEPLVDAAARRPSAFRVLFKKGTDADADLVAAEYAHHRIGRLDGVDIGELRRELCGFGVAENAGKGRLNLGFF